MIGLSSTVAWMKRVLRPFDGVASDRSRSVVVVHAEHVDTCARTDT